MPHLQRASLICRGLVVILELFNFRIQLYGWLGTQAPRKQNFAFLDKKNSFLVFF